MATIKVYLLDFQDIFYAEREIEDTDPFPMPCVTTPPPELVGEQVARWRYWDYTWEVLDQRPLPPVPVIQPYQIDQERDRRTAMGFVYAGKAYQTENQSQIDDILGKMTDALAAITVDQAQAGDLRWASPDYDFAWSAADGTLVPMDAQTCLDFTRAAVRRKTLLVAAGLTLKAQSPIPVDYMDDKYWPPMDTSAKAARK